MLLGDVSVGNPRGAIHGGIAPYGTIVENDISIFRSTVRGWLALGGLLYRTNLYYHGLAETRSCGDEPKNSSMTGDDPTRPRNVAPRGPSLSTQQNADPSKPGPGLAVLKLIIRCTSCMFFSGFRDSVPDAPVCEQFAPETHTKLSASCAPLRHKRVTATAAPCWLEPEVVATIR